MQSIIMQTAQSGAFKIGSELHQRLSQKAGRTLSPNELQTEFGRELAKNFEIVKTEAAVASAKQTKAVVRQIQVEAVARNLEGGGNLRASAQKAIREAASDWGSRNKVFTKTAYDSVSFKNLAQGAKAVDPNLLPIGAAAVLSVKAGYHIEAGARSFSDFARIMRAEANSAGVEWKTVRAGVEETYRDTVKKLNQTKPYGEQIKISEKEIERVKVEWRAEDLNEVIGISKQEEILSNGRLSRKDLKTRVYESEQFKHNNKHIKAKTEEEALRFSATGKREAQYLPTIDVKRLEKTAMMDALKTGYVVKHGGSYYFFYKSENVVGYNNGNPTKWVRIELTDNNDYHGHAIGINEVK